MTMQPSFLSASTLTGDAVVNPQGDSLGNLKDIMLDTSTGKITYAVLSFGGVFGLGDKLFAVPWSALRINGEEKNLVLNVAKERLKDAPGFNKDHWPNFADPAFGRTLNDYYRH